MPTDSLPFTAPTSEDKASVPVLSLTDRLLVDVPDLAILTPLSVRTLRRMDAAGDIPGRVAVGRRVLFQVEVVREWIRAGLPDRNQWAALQKRPGKR